jgi:uncharacterized protein YukE
MKETKETVGRMKDVYEKQVTKLKEEWKNGTSELCEKSYKIQLSIWEKRIKEYEEMLDKN